MANLAEICSEDFFRELGFAIKAEYPTVIDNDNAGEWVQRSAKQLSVYTKLNYGKLIALDTFDLTTNDLVQFIASRYALSLGKIYEAIKKEYDPLANTSVKETENNSGTDTSKRGGSDSSSTTGSTSTHYATTFDNPNTENETGKTTYTGTGNVTYGRTDTLQHGKNVTRSKDGNIGVMPTQNLLNLEYETRLRRTMFNAVITCVCICLTSGVWECDDNEC